MVKYKIINDNIDSWITRVGFFKSDGGHLFAQERKFPCEYRDEESQYTITLGNNMKDIRELRDFLNGLNLGGD